MADEGADALRQAGQALADAVDAAIEPWIEQNVAARAGRPAGGDDALGARVRSAADDARAEVVPKLRALLALDLDEQWTNPLAVIRGVVPHATAVLAELGVAPVDRDEHAEQLQPDDVYDLTPGAFADLGPDVHEPGLVWGATKAHLHLQRRKLSGTA
ncbi:MAG: hypothetical protein AAGD35_02980 [Actinomycetota bacterium]